MKIKNIKKMQNGKYKIKIDDQEITTYDDVIINNNILYKKDIDEDLYHQIGQDTIYYDAYNKTVSFILKKMRSEKEVNVFLKKFQLDAEDQNKIIEHLKCVGLINDRDFTKSFISDRIHLSNDGPNRIADALKDNNIDDDIIKEEMAKIDKAEIELKLNKLITKRVKVNHQYSEYKLKEKLKYDLICLGYDIRDINHVLDNCVFDDNDILKKEYLKCYRKLSKKYEGKELNQKLRQKLLTKGFSMSDIDSLLNNED